nr:uncharacterized protein LOC101048504 [Saimiri boliviensis boliviensis]
MESPCLELLTNLRVRDFFENQKKVMNPRPGRWGDWEKTGSMCVQTGKSLHTGSSCPSFRNLALLDSLQLQILVAGIKGQAQKSFTEGTYVGPNWTLQFTPCISEMCVKIQSMIYQTLDDLTLSLLCQRMPSHSVQ